MSEKEEKGLSVVTVQFEIGEYAMNFLKAYLDFIGTKETVEDVCRDMVYDKITDLRDHVRGLPHYDGQGFFDKYPYILLLESEEEQKETQSDC